MEGEKVHLLIIKKKNTDVPGASPPRWGAPVATVL
jgi:hypothetical protein